MDEFRIYCIVYYFQEILQHGAGILNAEQLQLLQQQGGQAISISGAQGMPNLSIPANALHLGKLTTYILQ